MFSVFVLCMDRQGEDGETRKGTLGWGRAEIGNHTESDAGKEQPRPTDITLEIRINCLVQ